MSTTYQQAREQLSSIMDWIRFAASEFHRSGAYFGHGTDNAWDEAVMLVTTSLHLPFNLSSDQLAAKTIMNERAILADRIQKRVEERIPVAYLVNEAWFAGLPFYVDERVLVPRSPISELLLNRISPWLDGEEPERILDLCCGSGCIGIAALQQFEDAQLDLADLSEDALNVAHVNVDRFNLHDQVAVIQSDLFENLAGQYDLILSNPPYVDAEDIEAMPEEYQHEPALGLASGNDGLDITRRILNEAHEYLSENGVLVVEVGNSWINLEQAFPQVPFNWVSFEHGGDGVFVFTKQELGRYLSHFRV